MKKIKTAVGYTAYIITLQELTLIGGLGICDSCNTFHTEGYLIPVMNLEYCPKCFRDWEKRTVYYTEDMEHETRASAYYENKIPLTK